MEERTQISEEMRSLLNEIRAAKQTAPFLKEQEIDNQKHAESTKRFLAGEINGAEYDDLTETEGPMPGVIERKTVSEYIALLKAIGFETEDWQKMVAHENDHMVEALALGVEPVYLVRFGKRIESGETKISMYPSISFEFPPEMPDNERRKIMRSVLEAPEDMSPSDRRQLGEE